MRSSTTACEPWPRILALERVDAFGSAIHPSRRLSGPCIHNDVTRSNAWECCDERLKVCDETNFLTESFPKFAKKGEELLLGFPQG